MNIFCVWQQRYDDDNFDNDVDHYDDELVMTMRKKNQFWEMIYNVVGEDVDLGFNNGDHDEEMK